MRDLIFRSFLWVAALLGHHRRRPGRHSAAHLTAPPKRPTTRRTDDTLVIPRRARVPEHVRERFLPVQADDVTLVRPYLTAHEREWERQRQRERRTAAALATMDIDFLPVVKVAL